MANNDYRQPYRQGPPVQQQYYDDQYDRRGYGDMRSNQEYEQHGQGYEGHNHNNSGAQNYQRHENGYEQYHQGRDRQYRDPHQNRSPNQMHRPEPDMRQQRSYQYDDRYRGQTQSRPAPAQEQYAQGPPQPRAAAGRPPRQMNGPGTTSRQEGNYGYGGMGDRLPKVRDRILEKTPVSPMTSSWDNPFPSFPSKKKQTESRPSGANGERKTGTEMVTPSQDYQRPSTAHGNQPVRAEQDLEATRPHTSQSQRKFEPFTNQTAIPAMPLRKEAPVQRPHTSHSQRNADSPNIASYRAEQHARQNDFDFHPQSRPYQDTPPMNVDGRPTARRAVTGPPSQPALEDEAYGSNQGTGDRSHGEFQAKEYPDEHEYRSPPPHAYGNQQAYHGLQQLPPQRTPSEQAYPDRVPNNHRRRSSDQAYGRQHSGEYQDTYQSSYRGVPLTKKISPDMPNFDALADAAPEKTEDYLGYMPSGQPYQKPAYQNSAVARLGPHQDHPAQDANDLVSPLAQFSFNLGDQGPSPQSPLHMDRPYGPQDYQGMQPRSPPTTEWPAQFDPRNGTRSREYPPNDLNAHAPGMHPKDTMSVRPGLAQPPVSSSSYEREDRVYTRGSLDHEFESSHNDNRHRPEMPPSQLSSQSEPSRLGYDQRVQARAGFAPPPQNPPRPATSASGGLGPPHDYGARSSSDSFQRTGMRNPDSLPAHPAPFRPGLMQPPPAPRPTPPPPQQQPYPPPPPQPQMHQRAPSGPTSSTEPEAPVTIQELNVLQKEYKNNPNDYALGLKFAKRLVEAAKVLASENGRADAKQTAKNRERYITDAHKIVKRLCSAGYPDAMFYLADCYGQGLLGLESDPKEAFSLYQSAAKIGHAQAAYRVAVCCELGAEEGGGTRRDPLKAVQWYKRAATLGDTPAMYKMGMIQLKGLLGQAKTPREAVTWLKRAAERADAENPHALHELGLLYENAQSGDYMLKDERYALQLFEQAADLDYKYSQFRLGSAYEYGLLGLPIDPRMSIAWYSRAAKQSEHQSEFALSGWYLTGSGPSGPGEAPLLQQSDTEAYLWARKAASSGLAKAEYAMGYYTEVGIGVTSNIEEAKRWYYRAAAQAHPKARERLEDLKKGGQRMQKTRVSRSNVGKQNEGECTVM